MPEVDGWQATQEIRAIESARPESAEHARVRITALTGLSSTEDCARCQKSGMDGL